MGIDPEKLFVLFVIALIVLGPQRLPKIAQSLGRGLAELRKYTSTVRSEMDSALAEPKAVVRSALDEAGLSDLGDLRNLRHPLRYIDAPSQPRGGAGSLAPDGPAGEALGDSAVDGAADGSVGYDEPAVGTPEFVGGADDDDPPLPDDPELN